MRNTMGKCINNTSKMKEHTGVPVSSVGLQADEDYKL